MSLDIACERPLETLKGQIHNDKSNAEGLLWLFIHFRRLKNSYMVVIMVVGRPLTIPWCLMTNQRLCS